MGGRRCSNVPRSPEQRPERYHWRGQARRRGPSMAVWRSTRRVGLTIDNDANAYIFLPMSKPPKPLHFRGDSHDVLATFPEDARRGAGFALYMVQIGRDPDDWKPMPTIGPGVREIRVRDEAGAFRLIYIAKFLEAVYVLHCFNKKSQQTAAKDIALSRKRLKELLEERSQ